MVRLDDSEESHESIKFSYIQQVFFRALTSSDFCTSAHTLETGGAVPETCSLFTNTDRSRSYPTGFLKFNDLALI